MGSIPTIPTYAYILMSDTKTRFFVRCKMTCLGGSEKGTCPCTGAYGCEEEQKNPETFKHYRKLALARMSRHLHLNTEEDK